MPGVWWVFLTIRWVAERARAHMCVFINLSPPASALCLPGPRSTTPGSCHTCARWHHTTTRQAVHTKMHKQVQAQRSERKVRVRVNWGKKDECWMNLVKLSSRFKLFSHCLPCFCKYSRWRHIRKLLIHSQTRRNQLHHQLGYFSLCLLHFIHVYCTPWTVESTLLAFPLKQRPSRRLPTSTCFGLNLRVEYFYSSPLPCLGTCPSTPPADRAQAHPNCAHDHLFKRVWAQCPSTERLCSNLIKWTGLWGQARSGPCPQWENVLKSLLFLWDSTVWAFWEVWRKGSFEYSWSFLLVSSAHIYTH